MLNQTIQRVGAVPAHRGVAGCGAMLILVACLLAGCSARAPYPGDWSMPAPDKAWCERPTGAFANYSSATTDTALPIYQLRLSDVFFGELLNDAAITHVEFATLDSGELEVKPWAGTTRLDASVRAKPSGPVGEGCRGRWIVKSGWDASAEMVAQSLIIVAGAVMPVASQHYYALNLTEAGDLSVNAVARMAGTVLWMFPLYARTDEVWYRFPPWTGGEP